jgi:hypothetical protein
MTRRRRPRPCRATCARVRGVIPVSCQAGGSQETKFGVITMRILHALVPVAVAAMIGSAGLLSAGAAARAPTAPAAAAQMHARGCPAGILPLPADGVQHAADRALAEAAKLYPGVNTRGAEVMAADRAAFAGVRGREVRALCGTRAASRTVVVQMLFPRMLPSASLSQSVVFVGRFAHRYKVWYVAH